MSISQTAVHKIKSYMNAAREEDGMEAAQVILILVIVVLGLIPVITLIRNAVADRGEEAYNGINNLEN